MKKLQFFVMIFLYTAVIIYGTLYFQAKYTNDVAYELIVMANELNARIAALSEYIDEQEIERKQLMSNQPKLNNDWAIQGEEDQ